VLSVTTDLPEVEVEDIGSDNFSEAALPIFGADPFDEFVVDTSAMRHPETTAWRELERG
jgi:hypothetical protein